MRWDPDPFDQYYWPPSVPREPTVSAYQQALESIGFSECEDGSLESGLVKVAVFGIGAELTHAARQLDDGTWTSKLGSLEDITHELQALEGADYGHVVLFMKREK